MNFGLNLFSIRNLIATESDFLATAIKLKEMGYSYMQFSGAQYDVGKIARVSEDVQMPVCLTHVPYNTISSSRIMPQICPIPSHKWKEAQNI